MVTHSTLFRFAGAAAALGGALRIAAAHIPYVANDDSLEWLYLVIDLGLLYGLFGIYLAQAPRLGWCGLAGFIVAATGVAVIVGPDGTLSGLSIYFTGVLLISVGLAILSVAMLLARTAIVVPLVWLSSTLIGAVGPQVFQGSGYPFAIAGILVGAGFLIAGVQLAQRDAA